MSVKNGEQHILGWNFPQKFMNDEYFEKLHIKTVIIQSTWRTLDFAQICSKLNDKILKN